MCIKLFGRQKIENKANKTWLWKKPYIWGCLIKKIKECQVVVKIICASI